MTENSIILQLAFFRSVGLVNTVKIHIDSSKGNSAVLQSSYFGIFPCLYLASPTGI